MSGGQSISNGRAQSGRFWLLLLLLCGTFAVLCHRGFLPYEVFFANDSALGAMKESSARLPGIFAGYWSDFWWLGGAVPSSSPSWSSLFATILSPEHYLKVYAPLTMVFLGCCAWFFFRQLRFAPMVCVIAGLGAGLNMHFFSNACWGLGTWDVSAGMVFVALGILVTPHIRQLWIKGILAGLSVGMVVMEGFDVGAIFSIYIAIFMLFYFLATEPDLPRAIAKAVGTGALVVFFAMFISASTLYTLVGTQLGGSVSAGTERDKEARWDFTVQWSIPKLESLRVFIPGLFGYRLREFTTSQDKSGSYWGSVAEDPRIEQLQSSDPSVRIRAAAFLGMPQDIQDVLKSNDTRARKEIVQQVKNSGLQLRHTGSGEYAGLLVCLLAVFGLVNSARTADSPYSLLERRSVWFWGIAALFSLMAAWGQHFFVFRLIYELPYLTNIRSPMKFMHPLNISLILLSGYGLEVLHRRYLAVAAPKNSQFSAALMAGMKKFSSFDKKWAIGCVIAIIASAAAYLILASSRADLIEYLNNNGFGGGLSDMAPQIASFSISEVGDYVIYLTLSAGLIFVILTGALSGRKAVYAWAGLAAITICDLARADAPWIRYFNYKEKYTMNSVVDVLRQTPWEHRVVSRFSPMGGYDLALSPVDQNFAAICHWWLENDYPYNDIESLEIDQAPRMPPLDGSYINNFSVHSGADLSPPAIQWASTHPRETEPRGIWNWVVQVTASARLWELTNTRYIFADARLADVLNNFVVPTNGFRTVFRMSMVQKPGVDVVEDAGDYTVVTNSDGPLALIEYKNALPRTKLYSNWQMEDDPATLQTLMSQAFDPHKTVIISSNTPLAEKPASPDADPGTASITHYQSKHVVIDVDAKTPAVLLLNDRTSEWWRAWVDGNPTPMLRCNYIMQGAFVPAGHHIVEFRFQPPLKFLYVSSAALVVGVLLGGFVIYSHFRREPRLVDKQP